MTPKAFLAVLIAFCIGVSAFGKGKKGKDDGEVPPTIVDVSPMSVTVNLGKDVQQTYSITAATKITLAGAPATPDDLRAGMAAKVTAGPDGQSAAEIDANAAPRVTKKQAPSKTSTVFVTY